MRDSNLLALRPAGALILTLLAAGCASTIPAAPPEQRAASDPWEPFNRSMNAFNDNVDRVALRPLARGYETILPRFARRGIGNFFSNLRAPLNIVNNLLQGDLKGGGIETGRFLVNSTLGIGGLIDIGSDAGWAPQLEDFGQTLAVWGVPDGPYFVVPFFGPRTLRDAVALPLDYLADPIYYVENDKARYALYTVRTIDIRAGLFAAESLLEDSFDPYLTLRESYLQNRHYNIHDGEPPEDEDFYDDFEEPEELED